METIEPTLVQRKQFKSETSYNNIPQMFYY